MIVYAVQLWEDPYEPPYTERIFGAFEDAEIYIESLVSGRKNASDAYWEAGTYFIPWITSQNPPPIEPIAKLASFEVE